MTRPSPTEHENRRCDPMLLQHLRATVHRLPGGHQAEVQADLARLSDVAARCLLHGIQGLQHKVQKARSQPWRRF